jgi:hypothetical protein
VNIQIGEEEVETWVFPETDQEIIGAAGTKDFVEIWDFFC